MTKLSLWKKAISKMFDKRFRKSPDDEIGVLRIKEVYLKDGEKRVKLQQEVFPDDPDDPENDSFFVDAGDLSLDELYNIYEEV